MIAHRELSCGVRTARRTPTTYVASKRPDGDHGTGEGSKPALTTWLPSAAQTKVPR